MIARTLMAVFSLMLGLVILWAGLALIFGLFAIVIGQLTGMAPKPKGWLFVICLFPVLLFSKAGRDRIADVLKKFN